MIPASIWMMAMRLRWQRSAGGSMVAPGHRTGGGALWAALSPRDRRTPARRTRCAGLRRAGRARTSADAARDHRLEPRAAHCRREAVLHALRGLRRWRDLASRRDDHA